MSELEELRAELRALREGIEALADEWRRDAGNFALDGVSTFNHTVNLTTRGTLYDCADDLCALLASSPAATGEAYYTCGHAYREPGCGWPCCGFPDRPAPVVAPSA